jgi:hypothetical protein
MSAGRFVVSGDLERDVSISGYSCEVHTDNQVENPKYLQMLHIKSIDKQFYAM